MNLAWTKSGQQQPAHEPHFSTKSATSVKAKPDHDEHILGNVKQALHASGYEQLRGIEAYCHHGRVILQGRITTYFMKQVAQEVVRTIAGVRDIDNDLRVICSC